MAVDEKGSPDLAISRRNLPHWRLAGAVYFITFRLKEGRLSPKEVSAVLKYVEKGDAVYYDLFAATVMPTHVHAVLRPKAGVSLARVLKGIKGGSARLINASRGGWGSVWQDETYDRIIRDDKEMGEKVEYVFRNALKWGICDDGWDYAGLYLKENK